MPLKVLPLRYEDFDDIENHANIYEIGDDLVAPLFSTAWPVDTREAARARLLYAMAQERRRFLGDKSVRYMKVIDSGDIESSGEAGEIVSIARWHYYPQGYDYDTMSHWEIADRSSVLPLQNFNVDLHDFVLTERDAARKTWMGQGKPVWVLMHLVTRTSHRGRGAAGMLVRWGLERAEEAALPAYLEAGAKGRPLYEKYGFQQIGDVQVLDLGRVGLSIKFSLINMVKYPESARAGNVEAPST